MDDSVSETGHQSEADHLKHVHDVDRAGHPTGHQSEPGSYNYELWWGEGSDSDQIISNHN